MDKKFGLPHAALVSALGILLILITTYVPMLGIAAIAIPVPFAIMATLCDKKYAFLSLIATLLVCMICVSPIYAISVCTINVIPGLIIGSLAKNNIKNENGNKFEPIYGGTIAFVVCIIAFYFISKTIFGMNLIQEFNKMIAEIITKQMAIMQDMNVNAYKDLKAEDVITLMSSMIPTMLFLQGLLSAFITYYLEVFMLKRVKILNIQKPTFRDFYLPGNAVGTTFMLYMLVLLLGFMNLGLYTDSIMLNLQMVFNFMFIIQGISVSIYYARKWLSQGTGKNVLVSGLLLGIFGTMGISFIGMLDSIIDFRKVRSYKST
ncbi:MAG: YybS family protein [Peptostreptococcaceae bacterium]